VEVSSLFWIERVKRFGSRQQWLDGTVNLVILWVRLLWNDGPDGRI
jgi:hypothetical protein